MESNFCKSVPCSKLEEKFLDDGVAELVKMLELHTTIILATALNYELATTYLKIFPIPEEIKSRYSILGMHPLVFYHISTNTVVSYRQIPIFGKDIVCRFHAKCISYKKACSSHAWRMQR